MLYIFLCLLLCCLLFTTTTCTVQSSVERSWSSNYSLIGDVLFSLPVHRPLQIALHNKCSSSVQECAAQNVTSNSMFVLGGSLRRSKAFDDLPDHFRHVMMNLFVFFQPALEDPLSHRFVGRLRFIDKSSNVNFAFPQHPCYFQDHDDDTMKPSSGMAILSCEWLPKLHNHVVLAPQLYDVIFELTEVILSMEEHFHLASTQGISTPELPIPSFKAMRSSGKSRLLMVGCTSVLSNVDELEKKHPGVVTAWLLHQLLHLQLDRIHIYDTDGTARKYLLPFIHLQLVQYYDRFLTEASFIDPQQRDDLAFNHCLWASQGYSEWVLHLQSFELFVFFTSMDNGEASRKYLTGLDSSNVSHVFLSHLFVRNDLKPVPLPPQVIADPHVNLLIVNTKVAISFATLGNSEDHMLMFAVSLTDLLDLDHFQDDQKFNSNARITQKSFLTWREQLQTQQNEFVKYLRELGFDQPVIDESFGSLHSTVEVPKTLLKFVFCFPGKLSIPPTGWGAVEIVIWNYYLELSAAGHSVHIITESNGTKVLEQIKELQPDVVQIHADAWCFLTRQISPLVKLVFFTTHNAYFDQLFRWSQIVTHNFLTLALSQASNDNLHFLAISKAHADIGTSVLHFPHSNVQVIPNGVEIEKFRFSDEPRLNHKTICLGQILERKFQTFLQSCFEEDEINFVGNKGCNAFNYNASNYLGEWSKEDVYANLTEYGNLILLSSAEGAPLVVLEALAAGLGVVTTTYGAANLDLNLPFITIIPDALLGNRQYIRKSVIRNREVAIAMRNEIRQYAKKTFSWSTSIVPKYLQTVHKLLNRSPSSNTASTILDSTFTMPSSKCGLISIVNPWKDGIDINLLSDQIVKWSQYHLSLGISHIVIFLLLDEDIVGRLRVHTEQFLSTNQVKILSAVKERTMFCTLTKQDLQAGSESVLYQHCEKYLLLSAQLMFQKLEINWMIHLLIHEEFLVWSPSNAPKPLQHSLEHLMKQVADNVDVIFVEKDTKANAQSVSKISRAFTKISNTVYHDLHTVITPAIEEVRTIMVDPNSLHVSNHIPSLN